MDFDAYSPGGFLNNKQAPQLKIKLWLLTIHKARSTADNQQCFLKKEIKLLFIKRNGIGIVDSVSNLRIRSF